MNLAISSTRAPVRLFLDHGTDEAPCEKFHLAQRGVTFESRWQFSPMSELVIQMEVPGNRRTGHRVPMQGVVLESRKTTAGLFETTVLLFAPTDSPVKLSCEEDSFSMA